jgi:hypothetical protein
MYLVKSQVTLEDVVRAAKGVWATKRHLVSEEYQYCIQPVLQTPPPDRCMPAPAQPAATPAPVAPTPQVTTSTSSTNCGAAEPTASPQPPVAAANSTAQEEAVLQAQIEQFIASPAPAQPAATPAPVAPTPQVTPAPPVPTAAPAEPTASPQPATAQPQTVTVATPVIDTPPTPPTVQVSSKPLAVAPTPPPDAQESNKNEDKPAGEQIIVKSGSSAPGWRTGNRCRNQWT